MLDPKDVSITLVESDEIGTIGVGEATIPDIIVFNRMLGLDEQEFMKATNATFKLGIEFIDWGRKGDRYIHPFSVHGVDMKGIDFHNYWLHERAGGGQHPIQQYSLCAVAASLGKFTLPDPNPRSLLSYIRYAYHFDATLYARYLRTYAGFRSLILGSVLGVPFVDWSHWLPCNSALAVPCRHAGPLLPYTRATARTAGWQWRIPTQQRTGNGHIYCREFINDDEAAAVLLANLDGETLAEPRQIRFTAGHRKTFWSKNCIAIGLAAGFLEPLESTSIYLIQEGVSRFISLFPDATLPDVVRNEYNRHMRTEFEQVRDFIILHFSATERDDTPFWNYCRTMSIPDTLRHKIELFRTAARVFRYEEELFSKPSWVAVLLGQNIVPRQRDPIVASLPHAMVHESLESMRLAMAQAATAMPTHEEFIRRYCHAGPGSS
jgi:tryptophan 7-halogenase